MGHDLINIRKMYKSYKLTKDVQMRISFLVATATIVIAVILLITIVHVSNLTSPPDRESTQTNSHTNKGKTSQHSEWIK